MEGRVRSFFDRVRKRLEREISSIFTKPKREPMPLDNPTDRKIAQVIFDNGDPMLPSEIRPELKRMDVDISENAIYRRLWKMSDEGIVEHFRGEGFEVVLGRRYFPFVPLAVALLAYGASIFLQSPALGVIACLFFASLFFYWKYEF